MAFQPGDILPGDLVRIIKYDPFKRIGYVKFYELLNDLLNNPFTRYVSHPLNPKTGLYTIVIDIDVYPANCSLMEEIRAVKIIYDTKILWTMAENINSLQKKPDNNLT